MNDKYSLGYAICNSIQENKDRIEELEEQIERLRKRNIDTLKREKKLLEEKENLIKYLENGIKECSLIQDEYIQGCDWKSIVEIYNTKTATYKEILEVVKGKKYD